MSLVEFGHSGFEVDIVENHDATRLTGRIGLDHVETHELAVVGVRQNHAKESESIASHVKRLGGQLLERVKGGLEVRDERLAADDRRGRGTFGPRSWTETSGAVCSATKSVMAGPIR